MGEVRRLSTAAKAVHPLEIPSFERPLREAIAGAGTALEIARCGTDRPKHGSYPARWFTALEVAEARGQLKVPLDLYDRALRPAGPDFVEVMIGMLSAAFPAMKGTDTDAMLKVELYVLALKDFPADLLASAACNALRACRFFPTVAELLGAGHEDGLEEKLRSRVKLRNIFAHALAERELAVPKPAFLPGPATARSDRWDMPIA